MDRPSIYIPIDRRLALARGANLLDRALGAALFADISGFTALTGALVHALGPQRGAEEITLHLNRIFEALTTEVYQAGGSLIGFSGDSITCWFDGDSGVRATTCALALQMRMAPFATLRPPGVGTISLALKAAVTAGDARRFVVGDPQVQLLDVIAGGAVDRLAVGEGLAHKGEVVVDAAVRATLGDQARALEVRRDEHSSDCFFVVDSLAQPAAPAPWPAPEPALDALQARPWLLRPVYERVTLGEGDFLTELRPVVSLFMRFRGIDYLGDAEAGEKLDQFVRAAQAVVARFDGHLLHLSFGDKGSYLSAAFGALVAHDDDATRAARAALDLRRLPADFDFLLPVQIGISRGRAWAGPYGGSSRRTYGVIGDDVNLAARLMMAATPGQILVSRRLAASATAFDYETLPDVRVKGRAEPVAVAALVAPRAAGGVRPVETRYALPMVGREAELTLISARLDQARAGHGQVVGLVADAGMGKSRLLAEVVRVALDQGFEVWRGDATTQGANTPYLIWQPIWRGLFGVDAGLPLDEQVEVVEAELRRVDPGLVGRMPLLDTPLNLPIPDNDLTRSFDAKLRKTALEALLSDYLKLRLRPVDGAPAQPLLLVLEDAHWLDPLSDDLLAELGRASAGLPVVIAAAYRPPQPGGQTAPSVMSQPHATVVALLDFTTAEAERLIDLKLVSIETAGVAPALLSELKSRLIERAQGNPFYIDEFMNYLRDAQLDLRDMPALARLDLPDNLQSLILGRIDQLLEHQKMTLKVASVVGRLFPAAWLWDAYPELGGPERVRDDLGRLHALDLTVQDRPEPELTYLFKHVLTQEVVYESLTYASRARLHEALARFVEALHADNLDQYLDLLAYHYAHSQNEAKQREYLRRAGEAAQAAYANQAAIDYYQRLLPLLADAERGAAMLKLGQALEMVGQWQATEGLYREAVALTERLGDTAGLARSQTALGALLRRRGEYDEAMVWLGAARQAFDALGDRLGLGQALHEAGTLAAQRGDYTTAEILYNESLGMRRAGGDVQGQANSLNNLGIIARSRGDHARARRLYAESLALNRAVGNRWAIANSLNNLANVVLDSGDLATARALHEEGLAIRREIGDRWAIANSLNNLGNVVRDQGDSAAAYALYTESIGIYREFGDRRALAYLLEDIGCLLAAHGAAVEAAQLVGAASALREASAAPLTPNEQRRLEQALEPARQALGAAAWAVAQRQGLGLTLDQAIQYALHCFPHP